MSGVTSSTTPIPGNTPETAATSEQPLQSMINPFGQSVYHQQTAASVPYMPPPGGFHVPMPQGAPPMPYPYQPPQGAPPMPYPYQPPQGAPPMPYPYHQNAGAVSYPYQQSVPAVAMQTQCPPVQAASAMTAQTEYHPSQPQGASHEVQPQAQLPAQATNQPEANSSRPSTPAAQAVPDQGIQQPYLPVQYAYPPNCIPRSWYPQNPFPPPYFQPSYYTPAIPPGQPGALPITIPHQQPAVNQAYNQQSPTVMASEAPQPLTAAPYAAAPFTMQDPQQQNPAGSVAEAPPPYEAAQTYPQPIATIPSDHSINQEQNNFEDPFLGATQASTTAPAEFNPPVLEKTTSREPGLLHQPSEDKSSMDQEADTLQLSTTEESTEQTVTAPDPISLSEHPLSDPISEEEKVDTPNPVDEAEADALVEEAYLLLNELPLDERTEVMAHVIDRLGRAECIDALVKALGEED